MARLWHESRKFYVTLSSDFTYRTALCNVTRNSCVVLTVGARSSWCASLGKFQSRKLPHNRYNPFIFSSTLSTTWVYLSCSSVTNDTQYSRPLNLSRPDLHPPTFVTLIAVKSQCQRAVRLARAVVCTVIVRVNPGKWGTTGWRRHVLRNILRENLCSLWKSLKIYFLEMLQSLPLKQLTICF